MDGKWRQIAWILAEWLTEKTGAADKAGTAGTHGAHAASAAPSPSQGEADKTLRVMRDETNSTVKKKHVPASAALAQVMKDVVPEPDNSGAGTLPRLERRIQVMERAFTDIVERHEKSLRDRQDAMCSVEEGVSALNRRLQQSDEHHADALADIKTMIAESSMRLNLLEMTSECVKQAVDPQGPVTVPIPENRTDDPGEINVSRDDEDPTPRGDETYISAARRAAIAAQTRQDESTKRRKGKSGRRRARFFLFGCMAPAVIGAAALFVLNRHTVTAEPAQPASVPQAVLTRQPQPIQQAQPAQAQPAQQPPKTETVAQIALPSLAALVDSFEQLQALASAGSVKAARDVGLRYLTGNGVDVDPAEAANWLLRASYEGDPTAQYWLATLYARGQGVPPDEFQANHWYETAAKAGNRRAMHSFALAHLEGWGRDKNVAEAARWFAKAAELGFVDSQFNLGVLYERGEGVPKNLADAYKWYAIAAAQGDKQAEDRLTVLAKVLPPANLALAQSAAVGFKPATLDENANLAVTPAFPGG